MLLEVIHDLEQVLSEVQRVDSVRLPFIARPLLHVRPHNEPMEGPLSLGVSDLVEHRGGNEKDRIGKSHQLYVETGNEVPVIGIVDNACRPNGEHAMHVESVPAPICPESSNAFHLNREAET